MLFLFFYLCKIKHCHEIIICSHTLSFYYSLFIFETLLSEMKIETTTGTNTEIGEGVRYGVGEGDSSLNVDQLENLVNDDPDKEDDKAIGNFFVKSKPLQGYHLTASFIKRLWLTIQHYHS